MRRYPIILLLIFVMLVGISFGAAPKNVIVLIGDGMGPEQVKAAGIYAHGSAGTLSFESLPYQGVCTTYSANASVTDSAASATAIATGVKVNNGVISMAVPGDGSEIETLLEYFKSKNKSTGLVTSVYVAHATPAGFGAHNVSRNNYTDIVNDYLNQTRPNVLMGGTKYITPAAAVTAGYTMVTDRASMAGLDLDAVEYVSGQFSGGEGNAIPWEYGGDFSSQPHLSEITTVALDILDNDPDGFLLMVEGGMIDWACHSNALERTIFETIEFSNATQVVLDWSAGRTDTLVIVTADHETGGLTVTGNNGQGVYPSVTWSSGSHTSANVGAYAIGVNAELVGGTMNNTDFFGICISDQLPTDLNGDLKVNLVDFAILSHQWMEAMDIDDLKGMAGSWLH